MDDIIRCNNSHTALKCHVNILNDLPIRQGRLVMTNGQAPSSSIYAYIISSFALLIYLTQQHMAPLAIWSSFRFKIFTSILLILFFSHIIIRSDGERTRDEFALISFKYLITYDPYGALASWGNNSLHFCNWFGVTCSNHSGNEPRVIALELRGINLAGSISPSLGNLSFLQNLYISENQLSGIIPHELSSLSNLQNLNLSYNSLTGKIPHTFSQFSLLQNISLRNNMIYGEIPSNLSLCSKLQIIDFRTNNLTGIIPTSLGSLKYLKRLILWNNFLEANEEKGWDFLTALTNCSSLQYLTVGKNRLTGLLPDSVANLSFHLLYLSMEENQIYGGIPLGIGRLVNLQVLIFGYNLLGGTIPPSIGEIHKLEWLYLGNNQFFGAIPSSFCNLSSLSILYMDTNHLEGGIPACLGNLTSLNILDLHLNNLTGHIPHSLENLFNLESIALYYNNLYGNIPPSLGNLQSLVVLSISYNKLSGFIPESIWNLTFLELLEIENNNLIGTLPMKTLPFLKSLHLSDNNLSGPIPASLFNSSALELLQLYENSFDGTIHTNIGNLKSLSKVLLNMNKLQARDIKEWSFISALTNCTNLKFLDLHANKLEGTLPHSIVNLTITLYVLNLEHNSISGNIPLEIGNLIGLNWLTFGGNNLTGTIPVGIGKLNSLQRLDLGNNILTGEIPDILGNLSMLNLLYLNDNSFSGYIPSSLGRCKLLMLLYLEDNKLIGSIPKEILSITSLSLGIDLSNNLLVGPLPAYVGLLVNLVYFSVSNNKLMGQIPSNLASCVELIYIYMDNNLFQGNIPSSLRALKSLEWFNLSHNNLSGKIPNFLESLKQLDLSYNHLEGEVPKNGVFLNTSAFSVYENDKLCGGIIELRLPPCLVNKLVSRKKHNSVMVLAIIIPITCIILFFIIILFIFLLWWSKNSKKKILLERLERDKKFVEVTYVELQRATNGFSSNNLIGQGSFGFVYMGNMNHKWQKSIAIKVFNLQQRGASKSFEVECKALRNVRHRNLVKILTSCSSIDHEGNDFKALVFEYMPNGNLEKWLHQPLIFDNDIRKKLTIIQRMNIIIDVASALDYLHNHGPIPIIHCDLKPSNVLLDEDMVAHVSDFGLARLLIETTMHSSQTSASSIILKGTIGYAAPEYGVANQVSVEGDVYSYGILLLEMFTGRRPTDEIFNEDLNLHVFIKDIISERAIDIMDPYLLLQEEEVAEVGEGILRMKSIRKHDLKCIVSMLKVGLLCSQESPTERMSISQVFNELCTIRNTFLKSSNNTTTHH